MTVVSDFIRDALGLIQAVSVTQPIKAQDMQTGIRTLNRLMARHEANAIALGWAPVSDAGDDVPLPAEAELPVLYALAVALAPHWGIAVSREVAEGAYTFGADLARDQAVATPVQSIVMVPVPAHGVGHSGGLTQGGVIG
jgi:hypothetical protein